MTRLEVRDVTVRFGGVTAVNEATIAADAGHVTALIGPNGAGKTTLFNVITGLQKPTAGRVFLDGHDITHTPTHRRARHGIARTFQRLEAFGSLTVEENIRVAADAIRSKNAKPAQVTRELIRRIGLERYAGVRADAVPTGVARLVELARALAIDPALLLLDEPSSGLSQAETAAFGELLRDLAAQGRAVLIVEHDMPLIMRVSDRIHVLDRGVLIASGTPGEVQADPAVRKAYLGEDEPPSDPNPTMAMPAVVEMDEETFVATYAGTHAAPPTRVAESAAETETETESEPEPESEAESEAVPESEEPPPSPDGAGPRSGGWF